MHLGITQVQAPPSSDERVTPDWLYDALDQEFHFEWDFAAIFDNAKVRRPDGVYYFGPDHPITGYRDALTVDWAVVLRERGCRMVGFCNPPYGRGQIMRWCAKAEHKAARGVTTVMLLPGDTSTEYFHRYVLTGERRWINQRLKFQGAPLDKHGRLPPAKFGSVLRIWRPTHKHWTF